jgi:hypothetical protein
MDVVVVVAAAAASTRIVEAAQMSAPAARASVEAAKTSVEAATITPARTMPAWPVAAAPAGPGPAADAAAAGTRIATRATGGPIGRARLRTTGGREAPRLLGSGGPSLRMLRALREGRGGGANIFREQDMEV